jgi:hypothetical protein
MPNNPPIRDIIVNKNFYVFLMLNFLFFDPNNHKKYDIVHSLSIKISGRYNLWL